MAIRKSWRKIKDDGASITYVSNWSTLVSVFEVRGKGWVVITPKKRYENQTKSKAKAIAKLYMSKNNS